MLYSIAAHAQVAAPVTDVPAVVVVPIVVAIGVGLVTGWIWAPVQAAAEALAHVADGIVGNLPDAADLGLDPTSGWLVGYSMLNTFLPMGEALLFAGIFVTVIVAAFGVRIAVIVWHLIPKPGIGT